MLFMAGVFFVSCTSATIIRSSDPESKIYVDDELKGTGTD